MRAKDAAVNMQDLHPAMGLALDVLDEVAREFGLPEITITAGRDGVHIAGSKHYSGEAVDGRLRDLLERFAARVREMLDEAKPRTYDVVLELTPTTCPKCGAALRGTHLHVEHDPK